MFTFGAALRGRLRRAASLGREEDERPDTHRVAILSHAFWVRRFGADAGVLGRSLRLNEQPYTVVGVLRPGFSGGTDHADLWLPFKSVGLAFPGADYVHDRRIRWAVSHARLRKGVTLEQAQADLDVLARGLAPTTRIRTPASASPSSPWSSPGWATCGRRSCCCSARPPWCWPRWR